MMSNPHTKAESFILRKATAEVYRPSMFYSAEKNSSVALHLSRKLFIPRESLFPDCTSTPLINHRAVEGTANPFPFGTKKCSVLLKIAGFI